MLTMRSRWLGFAFALFSPLIVVAIAACGLDDSVVEPMGSVNSPDGSSVDGTIGDGNAGDGSKGDASIDAPPPDGSGTTSQLVYANSQSDLYSFDVTTRTLTHLAALAGNCSDSQDDLAIDATGQLYIFNSNDAIYELAMNGACSNRNVLSAIAGDNLKIAARAAGTPLIVAVDSSHKDYYSIDPASTPNANVTTITTNFFSASPPSDFACSSGGTCWIALGRGECGAGSSSSCLYSFAADGSGTPTILGAIGVQPVGLAYASGALYSFADDGTIAKITLTGSPLASLVTVTLAAGTTTPDSWSGAASSSAYP